MTTIETLSPIVRQAMERGASFIERPNGNWVYRRYTIHDVPCFTSGEYATDVDAASAYLAWLTDEHARAPFPRCGGATRRKPDQHGATTMFEHRLGLHIIQFPSGRYGYVGSIPTDLCEEVEASMAAVLGCRTHRDAEGRLSEWKRPTFATEAEARAFAASRGYDPA